MPSAALNTKSDPWPFSAFTFTVQYLHGGAWAFLPCSRAAQESSSCTCLIACAQLQPRRPELVIFDRHTPQRQLCEPPKAACLRRGNPKKKSNPMGGPSRCPGSVRQWSQQTAGTLLSVAIDSERVKGSSILPRIDPLSAIIGAST